MAEAIVDGTLSTSRFFCHRCSIEIDSLLPDYTCPRCSTGFIEELKGSDSSSRMDTDNQDHSDIEIDVTSLNDIFDPESLPASLIRAAADISRNGGSFLSGAADISRNPGNRENGFRRRSSRMRGDPGLSQNASSRDFQQQQQQGFPLPQIDSLIQDLFFNLSGIGFGISQGQGGQAPVRLFLGNPGDYVWGQNGLDSIVTHLLNQMDGTGPPPLSKKLIEEIPTTTVSQKQIDSKLQCSVCWEDFVLDEAVKQLPCQHCYHSPCIVPWLELHGTCPICRQSLGDATTSEANQDTVGPSLAALFRAANEGSSSSSSSRTSSASVGSSSNNDSSNNI